jgi:dipeptidyl aminopeptidase/acylaminoacyl peptidase
VPVDQGLQMFTVLRRNGVPAEAPVFPDEGLGCSARTTAACGTRGFGWMKKYLK